MFYLMNTYRIICDAADCEYREEITVVGNLEGDSFHVKGWSMEKEYTRGGSVRSHFCPKCTKSRGV